MAKMPRMMPKCQIITMVLRNISAHHYEEQRNIRYSVDVYVSIPCTKWKNTSERSAYILWRTENRVLSEQRNIYSLEFDRSTTTINMAARLP